MYVFPAYADNRRIEDRALDTALEFAGITAEIALLVLLAHRRAYRLLPFFYSYIAWCVVSDCVMVFLQYRYASHYLQIFIVQVCLDSALQYGLMVELAWSVLRPVRASLPRGTVAGISLLLIAVGAATWPFYSSQTFLAFPPQWHFLACLQQSTAILRILLFLILAAGSHMLGIGWRDRELQVATGLGAYSLVSLAASIVHTHQSLEMMSYHVVDLLVTVSYFGSVLYWIVSFAQAETPRRDFTPQMHSLLLTIAGTAYAHRSYLSKVTGARDRSETHPLPLKAQAPSRHSDE